MPRSRFRREFAFSFGQPLSPSCQFDDWAISSREFAAIVAKVCDKNYGLRSLIHMILQSRFFQIKQRINGAHHL